MLYSLLMLFSIFKDRHLSQSLSELKRLAEKLRRIKSEEFPPKLVKPNI